MADFSLAFKQLNDLTTEKAERIIKAAVFDLTTAIISDSPADTGRLKGNWLVSFNTPIDSELDILDTSGRNTIKKAKNLIMNNKVPLVYWIQNNLPYAEKAEYGLWTTKQETIKTIGGYSKKSPEGMVRKNIMKFNYILNNNSKGL